MVPQSQLIQLFIHKSYLDKKKFIVKDTKKILSSLITNEKKINWNNLLGKKKTKNIQLGFM